MKTEELLANLTKASEVVSEASKKLWAASVSLPESLEINVVRLPAAASTVRIVSGTFMFMRYSLFTDENGEERQLSSGELEKICWIICKHLWLVYDLVEDIQRALAVDDNEYGTDLWVLSTAIAEMIDKFEGQTV